MLPTGTGQSCLAEAAVRAKRKGELLQMRVFDGFRVKGLLPLAVAGGLTMAFSVPVAVHAQALGWEGETGVFVTPLAYTGAVEGQKLHVVVAYHYFDAGPVVGQYHEASTEVSFGKRLEFGYTREFHIEGGDPQLSPLYQNGLDIFNGKAILVSENAGKTKWVPAVSVGFMARTGDRNVGDYVTWNPATNNGSNNGDVYLVATKVVPGTKKVPVVLSGGVRGTDAELWGMGGNAPGWDARAFGAVAFVLAGPGKSSITLGAEAAQQPLHPINFPGLNIPTTLTYCARIVPSSRRRLNLDAGVAQIAGVVGPGVNLKARHQFGVQVSYGF
jgi:hypothetical protein